MEESDSVSYSGYATLVDVSLIISSIIRSHHPRSQPTGVYAYSTLRLSLMPVPLGQDTLFVALSHRGPRYEPTLEQRVYSGLFPFLNSTFKDLSLRM